MNIYECIVNRQKEKMFLLVLTHDCRALHTKHNSYNSSALVIFNTNLGCYLKIKTGLFGINRYDCD